jgi:hypothetical protein
VSSVDEGIRTDTTSGPNSDGIHQKTPDEVLIKQIDFSGLMESGEAISAVNSVTITRDDGETPGASDLTEDSHAFADQAVQVTLSAGVLGVGYYILANVDTDAGQTLDGRVRMVVRSA